MAERSDISAEEARKRTKKARERARAAEKTEKENRDAEIEKFAEHYVNLMRQQLDEKVSDAASEGMTSTRLFFIDHKPREIYGDALARAFNKIKPELEEKGFALGFRSGTHDNTDYYGPFCEYAHVYISWDTRSLPR